MEYHPLEIELAKDLVMSEGFTSPEASVIVGMKTMPAWESRIPQAKEILEKIEESRFLDETTNQC